MRVGCGCGIMPWYSNFAGDMTALANPGLPQSAQFIQTNAWRCTLAMAASSLFSSMAQLKNDMPSSFTMSETKITKSSNASFRGSKVRQSSVRSSMCMFCTKYSASSSSFRPHRVCHVRMQP